MIPGAYERTHDSDVLDVGFLYRSGLGGRVYYTRSSVGKTGHLLGFGGLEYRGRFGWLLGQRSIGYRGWGIFVGVQRIADDERLLSVCLHIHYSTCVGNEDPWKIKFYYGVTSNASTEERWEDTGNGFWEEDFGSDPSGTHDLFLPESAWSGLWNAEGNVEFKYEDNCASGNSRFWYPMFGIPGAVRTWLTFVIQRQPKIHHSLTGG